MTNGEILQKIIDNGLLKRCVECQFSKLEDRQFEEDFFQDLCLIIMEYPNDKLNDAYTRHMNAFLTRIIQNNIFSSTSPYYKTYMKYQNIIQDIQPEEDDIEEED